MALFHLSSHQVTTRDFILQSFSMEQKHGPLSDNSRGIWMRLTSGVCGVYYAFPGGPALRMGRSADVGLLISHHSHTSSVPPALSSLVTLYLPIHLCTSTVEPLSHVWPLPRDWNHRSGRPRYTSGSESDLAPLNIGLATANHRTQNRKLARSTLVGTAASSTGQATR